MLEKLALDFDWDQPLPAAVERLISSAAQREDRFRTRRQADPPQSFYSSNFRLVYGALETAVAQGWARRGDSLLEWGSGVGAAACLWTLLGGRSCGIEYEPDLVLESQSLARAMRLDVRFVEGNFIPSNAWRLLEPLDDATRLERGGEDGYERLGRRLDAFQIIFVYPWPGERRFIEDVFENCAASGSLLLSFLGGDELDLQRKV